MSLRSILARPSFTVLVAIAVTGAVSACTPTDEVTAPAAPEVTEVRVLPDSLGGSVGARIQFSAEVRDNRGQAMQSERVSWTSSTPAVATVDSLGSVTLLSSGTTDIRATARGKTGRGKVTVTAPVLQSLLLMPGSVTLNSGATQQFSVSGTWSDGSTTTPSVTYSATGGTITATGMYTAGPTGGVHRVIAVQSGGALADTSTVTVVSPAVLQSLALSPASVTLNSGATQQFDVSGTWSDGSVRVPTVTYSATGGTISAAGLYTAGPTGGLYRVIAVHQGGTVADTSAITVVSPPVLQSIALTPASVTLNAGATQQFTVSAQWSDGSTTVPTVTYSASGGTITASGAYTAGAAGGLYRVIAVHQGGTRADTSAVTVVAATPPPPAGLANECAAPEAGWIWCDDFDANRLASYFEFDAAGGAFARVDGVGNDGSFGMRARFGVGTVSAGALHLAFGRTPQTFFRPVDAGTANHRDIYWRVYLRNQAGWTGGGGDKLTRAMILASSTSWAQAMIAHVWAGDDNSAYENVLMLDPARGTDASGNLLTTRYNDFANLTWLGISRGANPLFSAANVGRWHCIEAHVKLNDAGLSNGVNEIWVDGALDASRTGINWVGSYNAYGINAVFLENYWNNGSPAAQERYMDNFVVSTQRIGC